MTQTTGSNPLSLGTDYETLSNRFRPIFREIGAGSVEREKARALPHEPIAWLQKAGFGAVRVPVEYGGAGGLVRHPFLLVVWA
ncbi:monooxygenase, partial [Pseudomonas syringae]|nr:monooxygenase [Pseudomonas syringae]